jgi:phosphoglycerate dehydrogenase-like enzyme
MSDCLIISSLADEYAASLTQCDDVDISATACTSAEDALRRYAGQRIVLGDPDLVAPILSEMPAVDWVQSTWAGVLEFIQATRRDYVLTGVKDIFGQQISEYVIGYILAHELRIAERDVAQNNRKWSETPSGTLQNKRIGIMGTGSIGQHIAHTASTLGMQVKGLSRSGLPASGFSEVVPVQKLDAFLESTDYLVSVLPQTPATDDLLDEDALSHLPEHAFFINVGRGNVVNDSALIERLQCGTLAGAVLDVFDEEPLPKDSPLWSAPNLRITAHIAAVSHASLVVPIFVENLRLFQKNKSLKYVVDFSNGY